MVIGACDCYYRNRAINLWLRYGMKITQLQSQKIGSRNGGSD